ncbi:MAG: hypothetical protein JOY60_04755 [Burkholderiaceae bacterium]|nr:hypothetical protein [Burkholderiaceae bacterium]
MTAQPAKADDDGMQFSLSGFANLTVAKVLSGKQGTYQQWSCPCTIQNWEYVGVYEQSKGWQADQESLVGLQGSLRVNDSLSGTMQVLSRPHNDNYRPSVDWAYVSYALNDQWTIQVGRKRIPLYYYSDFLYIGTAYPWVRPAPDVYGWPIYAYDGANLAYSGAIDGGSWTLDANAWAGSFNTRNDAYDTKIYYTQPTDEAWRDIAGGYVTISDGVWSARAMLMTFKDQQVTHHPDGTITVNLDNDRTSIGALSLNYDGSHFIARSEFNRFQQAGTGSTYNYFLAGGGYKQGAWTGMYTLSHYTTTFNNIGSPIEGRRTQTFALRYDLNKNVALKAQYDISVDESRYDFFGNSTLMSFAIQSSF